MAESNAKGKMAALLFAAKKLPQRQYNILLKCLILAGYKRRQKEKSKFFHKFEWQVTEAGIQ